LKTKPLNIKWSKAPLSLTNKIFSKSMKKELIKIITKYVNCVGCYYFNIIKMDCNNKNPDFLEKEKCWKCNSYITEKELERKKK